MQCFLKSCPLFSYFLNFFTHHFILDFRWILTILLFIVFAKIQFTVRNNTYKMPLPFSFLLIGFFIWITENISIFFGCW
ncbi:DUF817 family protein [Bacillus sp. XF8]|uniref:DUF817 family protein n=1 Tax=Bacillus sp. XF8 TaxID=2819289 RepID=UPI0035AB82C3